MSDFPDWVRLAVLNAVVFEAAHHARITRELNELMQATPEVRYVAVRAAGK